MILQLKIKNYRSYKDEIVFSMEANSSDQKLDNVFEIDNDKHRFRLLKTAIIYGANASGKSNIVRIFFEIQKFILYKPKVDEPIGYFQPFIFDSVIKNEPSEFELTFLDTKSIKYIYSFSVHNNIVIKEELNYFPNGKTANIFVRQAYSNETRGQKGTFGDKFGGKEINVFANQLILSKFGEDEPHELLTDIFLYFRKIQIINATNEIHKDLISKQVSDEVYGDSAFKRKLAKLINAADTKIKDFNITKADEDHFVQTTQKSDKKQPYFISGIHDVYNNGKLVGVDSISFSEESTGTRSLYFLGGKILRALEAGTTLIVDELDTSLHPFITKMIVMLFQSKSTNPKNAQLLFTTHDVSLLDKDLIRRDQIWIAEKNDQGSSELFSLQDFEGLREDTSFEKWYLAGKFGGLPQIKSIESIFNEDE